MSTQDTRPGAWMEGQTTFVSPDADGTLQEVVVRTVEVIERQLALIGERAPGDYLDKRPVVQSLRAHVRRLRTALAAPSLPAGDGLTAPDGWKLVPVTPTADQLYELMSDGEKDAAIGMTPEHRALLIERAGIAERYEAMLEAAPQHQSAFLAAPRQPGEMGAGVPENCTYPKCQQTTAVGCVGVCSKTYLSAASAQQDEREAFEAWGIRDGGFVTFHKVCEEDGAYINPYAIKAWAAFQAGISYQLDKSVIPIGSEREAAERAYNSPAFSYERGPIGSHDWRFFHAGWKARTAQQVQADAGAVDAERIAREAVEQFKAALYRVPGFGNRVNKEVREKLTEAHCIMLNLPALLDRAAMSREQSGGES